MTKGKNNVLVLTLLDVEKDIIHKIAKDLCSLFNQESILVIEDIVKGLLVNRFKIG
jgi:hypothetical protein